MSLLVVGSMALDTIETPSGYREDLWGGSATYFAAAASFFNPVNLVAVIGDDFPEEILDYLGSRGICLNGVSRAQGETFRWKGRYGVSCGDAQTLDTNLGVFADFRPCLPKSYCDAEYVFLANIDPDLQREVLGQVRNPQFVACDTMNYWIEGKLESLKSTLAAIDLLVINDAEAKALGEERNLVLAAQKIMALGPSKLIIKRGENGVLFFDAKDIFAAPAFPLAEIIDPTGAGDSFAGGFMGYLAKSGRIDSEALRQAIVIGNVMASFAVEGFSLERIRSIHIDDLCDRLRQFRQLTQFQNIQEFESAEKGLAG